MIQSEDEEDQDFVEGTSDNDDSEEDEVEEEEDSVTPEEVHHIAYDAGKY